MRARTQLLLFISLLAAWFAYENVRSPTVLRQRAATALTEASPASELAIPLTWRNCGGMSVEAAKMAAASAMAANAPAVARSVSAPGPVV